MIWIIGTLSFTSGYTAGGTIAQGVTFNTVALSAGDVVEVNTDGTGTAAGNCRVTMEFSPS